MDPSWGIVIAFLFFMLIAVTVGTALLAGIAMLPVILLIRLGWIKRKWQAGVLITLLMCAVPGWSYWQQHVRANECFPKNGPILNDPTCLDSVNRGRPAIKLGIILASLFVGPLVGGRLTRRLMKDDAGAEPQ